MVALEFRSIIMARKMLVDGELSKPNEEEAHYDFDLFVIGAGSGGVRASRFSANFGAKVNNSTTLLFVDASSALTEAYHKYITWVHYVS